MASSRPKDKPRHLLPALKLVLSLSLFFSLWLLLLFLCFPSSPPPPAPPTTATESPPAKEQCEDPDIAPFYIHELPDRFNLGLLRQCRRLNIYTDMCPHVAHRGLGQPLAGHAAPAAASGPTWYATHQFIAEMIFHARAERHPCRTLDPAAARLFYVPFYGGLHASSQFREKNHTLRDELAVDLACQLRRHPGWRRHHGRDHFLALGRTSWDFMRSDSPAVPDFGANRLLRLPEVANMSVLTVERHPWEGHNQFGIPYPSYFHPRTAAEVAEWQDRVRRSERSHLFSFVGGARPGLEKAAVRDEILRQCGGSAKCLRVQCEPGSSDCHDPDRVLSVMLRSDFCMQAPGDSFTRRSVFDSVLAGCIPVFFSEHTAYSQYGWYLPGRREDWSVFIGPDGWGAMEAELGRIPREEVERMRDRVVGLIPAVTYAHPEAGRREVGFRDAVDVALVELSRMAQALNGTPGTVGTEESVE